MKDRARGLNFPGGEAQMPKSVRASIRGSRTSISILQQPTEHAFRQSPTGLTTLCVKACLLSKKFSLSSYYECLDMHNN